jgi:beta-lactamase class A
MSRRYSNYSIYSPSYQTARPVSPRAQKNSPISTKLLMAVLLVGALSGFYFFHGKHTQAVERKEAVAEAAQKAQNRQNFSNAVQKIINENSDTQISVSAIDLTDDSTVKVGKISAMNAASCGKVLTAALYLHDVEKGTQSLSDHFAGYSARYQLQQLIQQSDDNAWVMFNDELGHPALASYAQSLGLTSYDPDSNYISSADMAALLQELYSGQLLDQAHTELLLSYMQNTNYEDFIPPAVPESYQVYHKVGFVDGELNDAAIITNGKEKFVLSIFTNNPNVAKGSDTAMRAQLMQKITQAAILYLN